METGEMRVSMIAFTNIEYTIELSEALNDFVDLMLMMPEKQVERFRSVIASKVKLCPFKQSRMRYPTNLLHVWRMVEKIRAFDPDVVHIQRGDPWFNFSLPLLRRYGLVTTIHDVELHTGDKESTRIPEFTHKLAIHFADQIIVHGEELSAQMIKKTNKLTGDVNVLSRGINSIYTRYIEDNVETEPSLILFFGRIWEYKGLRYLIEAEPIVTKEIPDVKIIIAGRGENVNSYRKMMINEEKFIVYNHHISNKMVAELFQKASVVVLPYTDASQSGVVPLAYAFRKPVVVTNVGSLSEVVDDGITGHIVPPRDPRRLAEAIIDMLKDEEKRIRMGENGYRKATEQLSWNKIAEKTLYVYKKALLKRHLKDV
jgi:glycosyltransferase involved in cell wall biosynthesis